MGKRQNILRTATALFAHQGFHATTTAQIALEGDFTEPLLYHHFHGKDDLFTQIVSAIFGEYLSRLDALPEDTSTQFEKIENLIAAHFRFVHEMPEEALLITSACPARLNDPEGVCASYYKKARKHLVDYLSGCLKRGVASGEFHDVPVKDSTAMLIALLNGLLRQHSVKLSKLRAPMTTTVKFCRRSLVRNGND
jgi:AcrR family transcriptional regulator